MLHLKKSLIAAKSSKSARPSISSFKLRQHARSIDGVWSTVGSTNLDFWSLSRDDEVNAVILSHEFAIEMERMFVRDLAGSDQIKWEEWKKRPLFQRISEWFAHVFSRWM